MRTLALLVLAQGLALAAVSGPGWATEPDGARLALDLEATFVKLAESVAPSVVSITGYQRQSGAASTAAPGAGGGAAWRVGESAEPGYPGFERRNTITGFFIDQGLIVTCRHALVAEDGSFVDAIDVETQDGHHTLSRVVGAEPTIDLAVLALEVYPADRAPEFRPALLGDSDSVRPGNWALALGEPYGPARTYSLGLVSASPRRQCYQGDLTSTYMQVSMDVPAESYGGPLFNIRGEVVGMMTPRYAGATVEPPIPGLAFAMPMNVVAGIARALATKQSVESPWLGFSVLEIATLRARLRKEDPGALAKLSAPLTGIYIDDVYEPSPATRSGVRVGDYLVALDGHRLYSVIDFQKWLYLSGIGRRVKLELFRDGRTLELEASIEKRPPEATAR